MSQNLRVALTTSLNDQLVGPLRRALDEVEKNLKKVEQELGGVTQKSQQASQALTGLQGPDRAAKQVAELARNTQNAVTLADRLKTAWSAAGNMMRGVTAGVAAFQAAKYVVAAPLQQARSYEKQLADAANIAYSGKSTIERRAGMVDMDASVKAAVRSGGGTRESALVGMNALFAADVDKDDVKKLLPSIQKYSTAGNANPENIANLVIYGLRSLKLDAKDIPLMLDKTLASTNKGSMELDNLAKWMPQVGAAGGAAGMVGMKGYEQMLAGVQTSRLTAGTKDEAGTNFKDLLSMLNGHALMTAAKKMGIDVSGSLAKHIGDGGSAISGALMLSDYVVNADPRQQALQKRLKASGLKYDAKGQPIYTSEQQQIMAQQATLFAGSALGKLFHNQQSMQALVALRNNRDYFAANMDATGQAKGQIAEGNMSLIETTAEFQNQQKENEKLFALTDGLNPVNAALGKLADGATDLYRKYPGYATVVESASLAIGALAVSASTAGGVLALFSFLKKDSLVPPVPGGAGVPAAEGAAGAAAAGGLGMLGAATLGSVALGGSLASLFATNIVANNAEAFASMGADAGDTAFAAAIMNAGQNTASPVSQELITEVKALGSRPIRVILDGREIAASVNTYNEFFTRRN